MQCTRFLTGNLFQALSTSGFKFKWAGRVTVVFECNNGSRVQFLLTRMLWNYHLIPLFVAVLAPQTIFRSLSTEQAVCPVTQACCSTRGVGSPLL